MKNAPPPLLLPVRLTAAQMRRRLWLNRAILAIVIVLALLALRSLHGVNGAPNWGV